MVCHYGNVAEGLDEEGSQRMLEGGDGTVGVGEGGPEMSKDVGRRTPRGQFGRRAAPRKCRADLALAQAEALPDPLQGSVTQMAFGGTNGGGEAAGNGVLQKTPQRAGGQAQPSDLVGAPDAERPPATSPGMAIAAKDAPGADHFSRAAVVVTIQRTVANQRADNVAMRTGRQLEPLMDGVPLVVATIKPTLLCHARSMPREKRDCTGAKRRGVEAGYD